MKKKKLREEVEIELDLIKQTVSEIKQLLSQIKEIPPTNIEKTAAGAFLSQIYSGIEKILIRICKHNNISIPLGKDWHTELFKMFCDSPYNKLPNLIDSELENLLHPYRKFRHFFVHGYGVLIDIDQIMPGLINAEKVYKKIDKKLKEYLLNL